jgi:hypothetical protein
MATIRLLPDFKEFLQLLNVGNVGVRITGRRQSSRAWRLQFEPKPGRFGFGSLVGLKDGADILPSPRIDIGCGIQGCAGSATGRLRQNPRRRLIEGSDGLSILMLRHTPIGCDIYPYAAAYKGKVRQHKDRMRHLSVGRDKPR